MRFVCQWLCNYAILSKQSTSSESRLLQNSYIWNEAIHLFRFGSLRASALLLLASQRLTRYAFELCREETIFTRATNESNRSEWTRSKCNNKELHLSRQIHLDFFFDCDFQDESCSTHNFTIRCSKKCVRVPCVYLRKAKSFSFVK